VAEDPCLTYSFGMRAPSSAELISDWLDDLVANADESIRFQDPDLKLPEDPNEIDAAAMKRVVTALNALRMNDPDRLGDWFGRFITTYRSAGDILPSQAPRPLEEVEAELARGGELERHPWARLAWRRATRGGTLYCSGREFPLSVKDAQTLAAAEHIDATAYRKLSAKGRSAMLELLAGGYFQLLDVETLARLQAAAEELDDSDNDADDDHDAPEVEIEVFEYTQAAEGEPAQADIQTVNVSEDGVEVVVICDNDDTDTPAA
jgi:50S ribosomal protein L16 3-hydroxylase